MSGDPNDALAGRRVLVLGLGISGRSAARFCAARGARVVAADERAADEIAEVRELGPGVELVLGGGFPDPAGFDLVVPSPGVPPGRYAARARRVWGDLELAFRHLSVPIVAITGTNGKSTTTRLVEAMLRTTGLRAEAAGNIGAAALELVGKPLDVAVLEVSSFQLETIERFRARVAVILNVTPDHIDRHGDFAGYLAAKARILENQGPGDVAVLSADDPAVEGLASRCRAEVRFFSQRRPVSAGAMLDAGAAVLLGRRGATPLRVPLDDLRLTGTHNLENVLASLAAVAALGVDARKAAAALVDFDGLPHRTELVRRRAGVSFVNDSKGTNVGAALRSLESFREPIVWIGGGKDKDLDFAPLADAAVGRLRAAILIGQAAEKLARAFGGRVPVHRAASLEAAVALAAELALPGDVVLLSPACASFDQFKSYEDRGQRFRDAVQALPEAGGGA
ncbi:MAG TPA: UDP-N-acetylmuramoyl-L-alanine--D-glutamate ligase [Myxococcota bacterium]|jgi:UDP-N-acetylmuramoylalanine--D-glutamate ligase|nr:UDP-N-acetylmuramoyl-L-alanine--D-glutamate ligase [Myxococcota bacterium]